MNQKIETAVRNTTISKNDPRILEGVAVANAMHTFGNDRSSLPDSVPSSSN